jgi:hypothetical protein
MEDSVKLTDTQRRLLAAASQRDDGALKRPSRLTDGWSPSSSPPDRRDPIPRLVAGVAPRRG